MKEIKFRAWDKIHNKMAKVYTLGLSGIEYSTISVGNELYSGCDLNNIEIMQYIGLKDKNGKEIYEGDIISNYDNHYFLVIFYQGSFLLKHDFFKTFKPDNWEGLEIIGNKFENSDLLENK
jgi:uncharacterized phage protein (TIGR01671 family)